MARTAKILPVASGKGGVGKSFFTANLAIILAEMGQKVIAVDLDLGGSNLHSLLGIKNDLMGLGHYINDSDSVIKFEEIVHETPYKNLFFIPGDTLFVGTANLPFFKKKKIISELSNLDADWILLDLGSGSNANTVDFYLISNCGLLITTPDITAILNLYSFLKNAFYRYILMNYTKNNIIKQKLTDIKTMRLEKEDLRLYEYIRLLKKDYPEEGDKLDKIVHSFFPKIVINMSTNERDILFGENLRTIIHKNLGIDCEYLGLLPFEPLAKQAILARKPHYIMHKKSRWIDNCKEIARRIVKFEDYPKSIFNDDINSLDILYSDLKNIYAKNV